MLLAAYNAALTNLTTTGEEQAVANEQLVHANARCEAAVEPSNAITFHQVAGEHAGSSQGS